MPIKGIVEWSEEEAGFVIKEGDRETGFYYSELIVVGNKFENPELLERK